MKKEPLQRQAITVTPKELRKKADKLENEILDQYEKLGLPRDKTQARETRFSVAIIPL